MDTDRSAGLPVLGLREAGASGRVKCNIVKEICAFWEVSRLALYSYVGKLSESA